MCSLALSYRKVVSNNCTAGVIAEYTARRQHCPVQAPKGLHLVTSEGRLTATLGANVTFLVFLEEVSRFAVMPAAVESSKGNYFKINLLQISNQSVVVNHGDGCLITYKKIFPS